MLLTPVLFHLLCPLDSSYIADGATFQRKEWCEPLVPPLGICTVWRIDSGRIVNMWCAGFCSR